MRPVVEKTEYSNLRDPEMGMPALRASLELNGFHLNDQIDKTRGV